MYKYGESTHDEGKRRLRQFTFHSFRHTSGNMIRETTKDPYKAAVFLRHVPHKHFGSTAAYLHYPHEQLRADMDAALGDLIRELLS
jgi:integrase